MKEKMAAVVHFATLCGVLTTIGSVESVVLAEEAQGTVSQGWSGSSMGSVIYDSVEFKEPGEHYWEARQGVAFAILVGCGGGGGGGPQGNIHTHYGNKVITPTSSSGGGGGAGPVKTIVLGPLEPGMYRVRIGAGGEGGKRTSATLVGARPGENTYFDTRAEDGEWRPMVTFYGGAAGRGATSVRSREVYHNEVVTPAKASGGPQPGGGQGENGADSPWHAGGAGAGDCSNQVATRVCIGGGGGASSLGKGGSGGRGTKGHMDSTNKPGEDGGTCAGGGGAGLGHSWQVGGSGGDGDLRIIPLIDASILDEHVRRLLSTLDDAALRLRSAEEQDGEPSPRNPELTRSLSESGQNP